MSTEGAMYYTRALERGVPFADELVQMSVMPKRVNEFPMVRQAGFHREWIPIRMPNDSVVWLNIPRAQRAGMRVRDMLDRLLSDTDFEKMWPGQYVVRKSSQGGVRVVEDLNEEWEPASYRIYPLAMLPRRSRSLSPRRRQSRAKLSSQTGRSRTRSSKSRSSKSRSSKSRSSR